MDIEENNAEMGPQCTIQPGCVVGLRYREGCGPVCLGSNCIIRTGSILYGDVRTGDYFQCGHHVVIREHTTLGNHVVVGTHTVIDGNVEIGDFVKIESNCYIPTHVRIGTRVFIGPNTTLTNDRYPLKMRDLYRPEGPVIEDGVTLGAGVVVCPGVRIGHDCFVAAGAVITRDMPPETMAVGVPARFAALPEKLRERNVALSWRKYLNG